MNGLSSKNSTALTSSSIRAVISAMSALSAKCMRGGILTASPTRPRGRMAPGRVAMVRFVLIAAGALLALPFAAQAQVTYRCTSPEGKKYYGSTIPMQCMGRPVEQLNAQGLVVRRIDPEGERKEREEKEAASAK